eukprot:scaffold402_cov96-Isochrysis_galbana.AAC.2
MRPPGRIRTRRAAPAVLAALVVGAAANDARKCNRGAWPRQLRSAFPGRRHNGRMRTIDEGQQQKKSVPTHTAQQQLEAAAAAGQRAIAATMTDINRIKKVRRAAPFELHPLP